MLTNKIISVSIILISFSLASCGITNVEKNNKKMDIEKIEKKVQKYEINGEGKKGKSIGGNVNLDSNEETSIYNGGTDLPKGAPKDIK